ncbi:ATP-binding protein [Streptomyces incanus]|uniref:ATP-binding protein n=1 Tax=Streptomyces incanus TaxID=887453 RepID=A0ABW0XSM1_9ACTN
MCADAVRHGRVPGRDFRVRPAAEADGGRLRVAASDTRAERGPVATAPAPADAESESGRGLLLVAALADDRGVTDRCSGSGSGSGPGPGPGPGPGKTVWATVSAAPTSRPAGPAPFGKRRPPHALPTRHQARDDRSHPDGSDPSNRRRIGHRPDQALLDPYFAGPSIVKIK